MTTQLTRRTARRFAETVAECSYASRRLVELNTPWLARRHTTPSRRLVELNTRRHTTPAAGPALAAELATYRSPAELSDLHAMLQQHPDEETAEIRVILDGQAERRLFSQPTSWRAV